MRNYSLQRAAACTTSLLVDCNPSKPPSRSSSEALHRAQACGPAWARSLSPHCLRNIQRNIHIAAARRSQVHVLHLRQSTLHNAVEGHTLELRFSNLSCRSAWPRSAARPTGGAFSHNGMLCSYLRSCLPRGNIAHQLQSSNRSTLVSNCFTRTITWATLVAIGKQGLRGIRLTNPPLQRPTHTTANMSLSCSY